MRNRSNQGVNLLESIKYDPHLLNWLFCHYQTETVAAILHSIKAHTILNAHFIELNVLNTMY